MWRWVSIMPGITIPPAASISIVPSGTSRLGPTAAMRSPTTSTSASRRTSCASFIVRTMPPRRTTGRPGSISVLMSWALLSRDDDQLGAARCAALTLPRLADVLERDPLDVLRDLAARGMLGEAEVALAPDLERRMRDRESQEVERLRSQERRRHDGLRGGNAAHLDVAGKPPRRPHRGQSVLTPQEVDRDVDALRRGLLEPVDQRRR